jgi:hypothetical protein
MDLSRRSLLASFGASGVAALARLAPATAAPASAPPAAPPVLPPIDAGRIASRIVSSLQPAAGERAILVYDPLYYPELADAIQAGLRAAGANPVVLLTFDPPAIVQAEAASSIPSAGIEERTVAFLRPLFDQAAMFLWLPARALSNDTRWEHLVGGSRARGIHFHWILPLEGHDPDEVVTLSRIYERAILETDYPALSREQDRLIAALRGRSLRITDARGSDLRLRVPADAWFHKNDGDVSPARGAAARCARDREMEFPSGALRFIPDVSSTEGRLVVATPVPRSATSPPEADTITLEFERGRAVRRRAAKDEAALARMWEGIGGDIDKVGEIVIGTNPLLAGTLPSGTLPYYGYGVGHVRVSMGDNWESGGANRSPSGRPLWLFLDKPTVDSGSQVLVKDGQLVSR